MTRSVASSTRLGPLRAALCGAWGLFVCACAAPARPEPAPGPAARGAPACVERAAPLAWGRAEGFARPAGGELVQRVEGEGERALGFYGAHAYDLLERLASLSGEEARRALACEVLNRIAERGAPVVRIWGSLRRTGDGAELARAREALALLLDEDARRARPLRFVVTLANHQAGYGAPDPSRGLEEQDPRSPWHAARFYLRGGWRERGAGLLAERIEAFAAEPSIAGSPYVLGWELVNELDTFGVAGRGHFEGLDADALSRGFLDPALRALAGRLPHPILAGDLRGFGGRGYSRFVRALVGGLPEEARARLVWTAHAYHEPGRTPRRAPTKLDQDLALAEALGLPFVLGEVGEYVRTERAHGPCGDGPRHALDAVFADLFEPGELRPSRGRIRMALAWGEGLCDVEARHPSVPSTLAVGVGGDTADLSPRDAASHERIARLRAESRFRPLPFESKR